MWRKALLSGAAAALAAGGVAYEIERRRLLRARDADPNWHALMAPLEGGRPHEVVSADGTRLRTLVFGPEEGRTIVLIHGWLEAIELWHHQIRELSRDFRVVAYELRGHAGSAPPHSEAYTDEALSDDLEAVLDACVPADAPCLVAGHSMGGMTIAAWAGRHVEQVQTRLAAVVFLNTGMSEFVTRATVFGEGLGRRLHRVGMHAVFLSELAWPPVLDGPSYYLTKRLAFGPRASVGQVAFGHRMFVAAKPQVRAGFGRMLMSLDLLPSLVAITVPSIVVGSTFDRLLPLWYSERLAAALPDLVEFVELTEVGHMSPLEEPERVTRLIGRLGRACMPVRPRTLEHAAATRPPEVAAMPAAPRTPEPDPDHVTPTDVAEMSQGAPGEASETAGDLSENAKRRRRPRKSPAAQKGGGKREPTSR